MATNFTLKPNSDNSRYLLCQEGESESREFTSFRGALEYVRGRLGSDQTHMVLYDRFGCPSVSFPVAQRSTAIPEF